jgi:hypothetical protein
MKLVCVCRVQAQRCTAFMDTLKPVLHDDDDVISKAHLSMPWCWADGMQ